MKKITALLLAFTLITAMAMGGCSSQTAASSTVASTAPASAAPSGVAKVDGKAACILGVGGLGDQSFNDLVYEGMNKAKTELGVDFDYAEPKQISDFELIIRDMASSGKYKVILCVGFDQVDPLKKIAPEFPDQQFALIDGQVDAKNVVNYMSKEEEGSFLVGAMAGLMKKNAVANHLKEGNQLGFVGAMEIPLIVKFAAGFQAGAKYVNPDAKVLIDYVSGSNPFSDTTTAKEIATSQFSKGADIIFHAAGGSGLGVFQAAKESGFYAIGCNSNQNTIDPDHIVASMLKRVDTAAYDVVKSAVIDNNLKVSTTVLLGLSDEGVGYTFQKSNIKVSDDIIAKVEAIKADVISGKLVVPQTNDDVAKFLKSNTYSK